MRILITGGTGIIGKKLLSELSYFNYSIRILTRVAENHDKNSVISEYTVGDLNDKNSLEASTYNIDTVIHLAAITHTNNQALYYKINTDGTKNLLEVCEKNNVKNFIFVSTRVACIAGGAYAYSKLLAEEAVKSSSLNWIILRPAEIYGAGEKEAVAKLIKIIKKSKFVPIIGNGQYVLSPVFIDDILRCIIEILQKNLYTKIIYTLAGPEEYTFTQLTDKISEALNVKRIKIFIPIFLLKTLVFFYSILSDVMPSSEIKSLAFCALNHVIFLWQKKI